MQVKFSQKLNKIPIRNKSRDNYSRFPLVIIVVTALHQGLDKLPLWLTFSAGLAVPTPAVTLLVYVEVFTRDSGHKFCDIPRRPWVTGELWYQTLLGLTSVAPRSIKYLCKNQCILKNMDSNFDYIVIE